ncbi:MAG: hypothetical protein F6K03_15120, partial [Kamptonema sp. SIO4C4]|nr:hypothetical protein [Kamptonema sp. SIO4C4]
MQEFLVLIRCGRPRGRALLPGPPRRSQPRRRRRRHPPHRYRDEEGDLVSIRSDYELEDAKRTFKRHKATL